MAKDKKPKDKKEKKSKKKDKALKKKQRALEAELKPVIDALTAPKEPQEAITIEPDNEPSIEPIEQTVSETIEETVYQTEVTETHDSVEQVEEIIPEHKPPLDEVSDETHSNDINRPQLAADLFQSDYQGAASSASGVCISCTQAVLLPYAKAIGLSDKQCLALGRGFAMGMMHDSTCGALIGAVMLSGLAGGSLNDAAQIFDEFQKRYGSTACKDILEGPTVCRDIIKNACLLYEKCTGTSADITD